MSGDSPRRGMNRGVHIVSPQPISDKSIIDSVAGIINDIVPQAYIGLPNSDSKESITWARFEYADINDPNFYPDNNEGSSIPPLLLVLGYTTGVQVWLITASGEATEVLSWRQGVVRTLRILPNVKSNDENRVDPYKLKRPLIALCDSSGGSPQFCNASFLSLKTGEQIKSIKFKSPVCDILANKRSIVITFVERIAVFDARTLEDVISVTTCYPSPGPNPNPVALGTRWLAYSEKKLIQSKRSSGGRNADGVQSYTATVLYAAKSLGKGLRGLGETVASSLTGNSVPAVNVNNINNADVNQAGVITILDLQAAKEEKEDKNASVETIIAHFTAHTDPIVAMTFDSTGALLMTADKRGHDFYIFRIHPHPGGSTLAAIHHLYTLHRGDTTAKVQDMVFSTDARWAAISTVRGTTHVFPVAPYGGSVGMRTHSSPHVVNRLSRFHRSAGFTEGVRSSSPISQNEQNIITFNNTNPRLPPYPTPTTIVPLAQIRQPTALNHVNNQTQQRVQPRQQRLPSDENLTLPLKLCACFAPPRAWIYSQRDCQNKLIRKAVDSLFIMACHGNMIQYDLDVKPLSGVPKEKICDDTPIELEVEAKGQWPLHRITGSSDVTPPLSASNPLLTIPKYEIVNQVNGNEGRWLSQVEIFSHAGPHRRLWMGPQFSFKTYNAPSGVAANMVESETIEIGIGSRPARSNPVNMPHGSGRPLVPLVIDGSGSSYEQSPRFVEAFGDALDHDSMGVLNSGENQLKEDLAEAMLDTSSAPQKIVGLPTPPLSMTSTSLIERVVQPINRIVHPLGNEITVLTIEEDNNSEQELELEVEIEPQPEPPKSVCAEEGPASLGDLENLDQGQELREHTEICAEMSVTSDPAIIDSVLEDNIKDVVKETKTLCAEAAVIDFKSDFDTICDVPTAGKLCAEEGAVPDSSVSQLKDEIWGKGEPAKKKELEQQNEPEPSCILNCDEETTMVIEAKPHAKKLWNNKQVGSKKGANNGAAKKTKNFSKEKKKSTKIIDKRYVKEASPQKKDVKESSPCLELTASDYQIIESDIDTVIVSENQSDEILVPIKEDKIEEKSIGQNIISEDDEDIELINKSELLDKKEFQSLDQEAKENAQELKNILSSDDDIEHILHSEVDTEKVETAEENLKKDNDLAEVNKKEVKPIEPEKIVKPVEQLSKTRSHSKKAKMRSSNVSKRQPNSTFDDMVEIINIDSEEKKENKDMEVNAGSSFVDSTKDETMDMVEIIDIDALERADKLNNPAIAECKIYMGQSNIRKKSKRHKKYQQQEHPTLLPTSASCNLASGEAQSVMSFSPETSWDALLTAEEDELIFDNKEALKNELESLLEIEEDIDENKENISIAESEPKIEKVVTLPVVTLQEQVKNVEVPKEEASSDCCGDLERELLVVDTSIVPMDVVDDSKDLQMCLDKNIVGGGGASASVMCGLTGASANSKKTNKWKKKKRR